MSVTAALVATRLVWVKAARMAGRAVQFLIPWELAAMVSLVVGGPTLVRALRELPSGQAVRLLLGSLVMLAAPVIMWNAQRKKR